MNCEHYESTGSSVEKAIENGMRALGITDRDELEIEVLEEGDLGGGDGWTAKRARVRLQLKGCAVAVEPEAAPQEELQVDFLVALLLGLILLLLGQ